MQAIGDLAKNQQVSVTRESLRKQQECTKRQLPEHWQTALFEKFKKTYRNKFTSKFADTVEYEETMREWGVALADLTPAQIKLGIELSIKTLAWPPEISEFIELAKSGGRDWRQGGMAYKTFRKALPKPINRELAKSSIANLKAICGTG